jgi:hypothetical protein
MFKAGDRVQVISDGRAGQIKNVRGHIDAANKPDAVETVDDCLVAFGNDITKGEWFKPAQLQPAK